MKIIKKVIMFLALINLMSSLVFAYTPTYSRLETGGLLLLLFWRLGAFFVKDYWIIIIAYFIYLYIEYRILMMRLKSEQLKSQFH